MWSETENLYTGLKSDYAGYLANLAGALGPRVRLSWRGRVYTIDNDDVFVDTVERTTPGGPQAGRTYEEVYGVNYDWWRLSALDRDVLESQVDVAYKLGGKGGTVKLTWDSARASEPARAAGRVTKRRDPHDLSHPKVPRARREACLRVTVPAPAADINSPRGGVFRLADSLPSQGRAPQSGHRWQNGSRP